VLIAVAGIESLGHALLVQRMMLIVAFFQDVVVEPFL